MSVAEARRLLNISQRVARRVEHPRWWLLAEAHALAYDLAVAQAHPTTGLRARQEAVWTARTGGAA